MVWPFDSLFGSSAKSADCGNAKKCDTGKCSDPSKCDDKPKAQACNAWPDAPASAAPAAAAATAAAASASAANSGPQKVVVDGKELKICCACPETKKARDDCMIANGEDKCQEYIEAHKVCLRNLGFKI